MYIKKIITINEKILDNIRVYGINDKPNIGEKRRLWTVSNMMENTNKSHEVNGNINYNFKTCLWYPSHYIIK